MAGTPIRLPAAIAGFAVAVASGLPALARAAGATQEGAYLVTRSQTIAPTPQGMVGRKTTDRETHVGNVLTTEGNSKDILLTIGGFVKKCPTAEGVVAGNFEHTLSVDEVKTIQGETQRTHTSNSLIAELKGQVGTDATLEYIEMQGEITRRNGAQTERRPIPPTRFRPGQQGELDLKAALQAVEMTADLSTATAMLIAGNAYMAAELEWRKPNQCVEIAFDPPSGTHPLGPNKSTQVQVTLRTKDGGTPVAEARFEADALHGGGSVTPPEGQAPANAALALTYTAPANISAGNGFGIGTLSRAGGASAEWKSPASYRGWSGQIKYTLESGADEQHTVLQDASGHSFYQLTFAFKNGVGTATSHAEVKSSRENRRAVDRGGGVFGQNVSYVKESSDATEGSLDGSSPATLQVDFLAANGVYLIAPGWTPTVGKQRHVSCDSKTCTTQLLYFSTDPQRDTRIEGKTGDPNQLQGTHTQKGDGFNWTVTWNLWRSN